MEAPRGAKSAQSGHGRQCNANCTDLDVPTLFFTAIWSCPGLATGRSVHQPSTSTVEAGSSYSDHGIRRTDGRGGGAAFVPLLHAMTIARRPAQMFSKA